MAARWGSARLAEAGASTDGKGHYVMYMPSGGSSRPNSTLATASDAVCVPIVDLLGGTRPFDRAVNPTANPDFGGADITSTSSVVLDAAGGPRAVHCGSGHRSAARGRAEATTLLTAASFAPIPNPRAACLARDERGSLLRRQGLDGRARDLRSAACSSVPGQHEAEDD